MLCIIDLLVTSLFILFIHFLLYRLMQKFEVVFPLDKENFLIPSKLPEKASELNSRVKSYGIKTSECLKRYYHFSYIPVGFWGRLISRLMFFKSPMQQEEQVFFSIELILFMPEEMICTASPSPFPPPPISMPEYVKSRATPSFHSLCTL